jgi:hypothetical protein
MQFLILSPPMITPAEPPSGPFLLTAALTARGIEAASMDLSLAFTRKLLREAPEGRGCPPVPGALEYLCGTSSGYDPHLHRTASGILGSAVGNYSAAFPGWRMSLMDSVPPCDAHSPGELLQLCASGVRTPFAGLWEEELDPVLREVTPKEVLISLSYLSQLPAAVDLHLHLVSKGIRPRVGGSLPRSLARSGEGLDLLAAVFPGLTTGDGSELTGGGEPLLSRLAWPVQVGRDPEYVSARPVIPFTLSTGCWWDRCLFCPDRGLEHHTIGRDALEGFLSTVPGEIMTRRPLFHFLDSAIPPSAFSWLPGIMAGTGGSWFGFVRPTRHLLHPDGLLETLAGSGCAMLQTGVESGSPGILDRFRKGLDPLTAVEVLRCSAEAGIRNYVYLLFGLPGETAEDRELTLGLLEETGDSIDFLNVSIFNLPWNSELNSRAADFGMKPGDFDAPAHSIRLYRPFTCDGGNPRTEARTFLRERLSTLPAASAAVSRTPRWFRGSHMAMMRLPGRGDPGRGGGRLPAASVRQGPGSLPGGGG